MANLGTADGDVADRLNDFPQNFFDKYRRCGATSDESKMQECFQMFDNDGDGYLNAVEFDNLLSQLFSKRGKSYTLTSEQRVELFNLVDSNKDGKIDSEEFQCCWSKWISRILDPVTAFIIVDAQNDFITGSLAINGAETVLPTINQVLDHFKFDVVVFTLDWHPDNHISFVENVKKREIDPMSKTKAEHAKVKDELIFRIPGCKEGRIQTVWPKHCVQNSEGAKIHKDINTPNSAVYIYKGTDPDIDSYSAFWDNGQLRHTDLEAELVKRGITDVYCVGFAIDICVRFTALDSIAQGFRTVVINDCCKGVDPDSVEPSKEQIRSEGGICIDISEMADIYNLIDRRPELGLSSARSVLTCGDQRSKVQRRVINHETS